MKKLESLIGVPIFDRSNGRIALNEAGKVAVASARKALEANRLVIQETRAFDRGRNTIVLATSNIPPANRVIPLVQDLFLGMAVTTVLDGNDGLLQGLLDRGYQLAVFHGRPESAGVFCEAIMDENLMVSVPRDHPLAARESICFEELADTYVIAAANAGNWLQVCQRHMPTERMSIQANLSTVRELVRSSSMAAFCSDLVIERESDYPGRVFLPVEDEDAHSTYYLACRDDERGRFAAIFEAASHAGW